MPSFKIHTVESAPAKSRETLKQVQEKIGFIPNAVAEMAESPALLKGYWELSEAMKLGSFSPVEREIVQLSASMLNDCGYCIAAHSTLGEKAGVPRDVIDSIRADKPLKDAKHEALRVFTHSVMKRLGRTEDADIEAFYKAGYAPVHVMEVVLGVTAKIMTNYVNLIARTPLDKAFGQNRFEEGKRDARKPHAA